MGSVVTATMICARHASKMLVAISWFARLTVNRSFTIEWPTLTFTPSSRPVLVGVVGEHARIRGGKTYQCSERDRHDEDLEPDAVDPRDPTNLRDVRGRATSVSRFR